MQRVPLRAILGLSVALFTIQPLIAAHNPAASDMAKAANTLLQALSDDQKQKASFTLEDDHRKDWHFIPKERKGLPIKEMTQEQRPLVHALLASGLSQRGYLKATTVMSLEQILADIEQGRGFARDPERYFISLFGTPAPDGTWAWRFEGHHLSLSFTIVRGELFSATPSFMGSNPGEVRQPRRKGLRALAEEEDLGRELATSLTADQRKKAFLEGEVPKDILTVANRTITPLSPKGLNYSSLNRDQKALLRRLIEEYIRRARPEIADTTWKTIEKELNQVHFAWAGELTPGKPHYYRVQGNSFLLEYDNTQNDANHVHAVWRDFANDYGNDLLREHYEREHKTK